MKVGCDEDKRRWDLQKGRKVKIKMIILAKQIEIKMKNRLS